VLYFLLQYNSFNSNQKFKQERVYFYIIQQLHKKFASTNHFILAKNFEEEVNSLVKIEEEK
jgi:DNA-binding GntR family transcriptional regulator